MSKNILRIKDVIKGKGLSIEYVAKQLNINQSALSQSINGNPTVEKLAQIANVLGVPITDLFEQPKESSLRCPKCGAKLKLVEE